VVVAGLIWSRGHPRAFVGFLLSVLGSLATTYSAKFAIARQRPVFDTFASAVTPSFPSGHATSAVAVYGFIIYVITRELSGHRLRFEIRYWGIAFILFLAATRVILSMHYTSDVIAGLLVGTCWLLLGCAWARRPT